jgi:hypothetical protein
MERDRHGGLAVKRGTWLEVVLHPLLIAAMLGCIAISAAELVQLLVPDIPATYLVGVCAVGTLEASYSFRMLRAGRSMGGTNVIRFRAIEMIVLLIIVKIGAYLGDSWSAVVADVLAWPRDPLAFFDLDTIVGFSFAFFSWVVATDTADDLTRIGEPPEHDRGYVPPLQSLTARFFWGGALLMILTGLRSVRFESLLDPQRLSISGPVLSVLIYFLLGLVMLGQIHLARLHRRWRAEGIPMQPQLAGRWVRYGLIFVTLVALIAFLLPTSYTAGILDVVAGVLQLIGAVVWIIFGLLLYPIIMLLYYLTRHSSWPVEPPSPEDLLPPPQLRPGGAGGGAPAWLSVVRSFVFWAVMLGFAFYVIRAYLRDRPELVQSFRRVRPFDLLLRLVSALWRRMRGWARAVNERFPLRLSLRPDQRAPAAHLPGFLRLSGLSRRERIWYYYLSILRRARDRGVPRRTSQTPYEYSQTLGSRVSDVEQEFEQLTQAFVEAKYSRHTVGHEHERRVRHIWRRVRAALRALGPASRRTAVGGE